MFWVSDLKGDMIPCAQLLFDPESFCDKENPFYSGLSRDFCLDKRRVFLSPRDRSLEYKTDSSIPRHAGLCSSVWGIVNAVIGLWLRISVR